MSSKRGFTLVEILVAMGLASVLALGLASVMTNSFKGQKGVTDNADFNAALATINLILANPTVCAAAFQSDPPAGSPAGTKGTPVSISFSSTGALNTILPTPGYSGIPVGRLAVGTDGPPPAWTPLIEAGPLQVPGAQGGWKNQLLITKNNMNVGGSTFLVNLNFSRTFIGNSFNNSSAVGGTFNSRDIPLMVTLANASGGAITGCRLAGPGDTSCPPGYTLVGTPGSIEAFCISSTPEVKALGLAGFKNCNAGAAPPLNNPTSISGSPVQNAHMCTPQEWAEACINAPGFQASATAGEEWTFQLVFYNNGSSGQQSGIRMNSNINPGTCFAFSGDAGENFFSTQLPYRCCFR